MRDLLRLLREPVPVPRWNVYGILVCSLTALVLELLKALS